MTVYERDKKSIMKSQKKNFSRIVINLKKEEKERWQQFAESQDMPLATLIRQMMNERMNKTYE